MSCKVELIEKNPTVQIEVSKWSIKGFLNDLLGETKGLL